MAEIGDVLVVAPDKPQHGSHNNKQHLIKQNFKENDVIEEYSCLEPLEVKLAVNEIPKESRICVLC
jgi:5'-nucleotidase